MQNFPEITFIGAFVFLVVGVLYCFLGYRTLKFTIVLSGFLLAGVVAFVLSSLFTPSPVISGICALGGGISGALALVFLYRAGVFILGVVGSALIAHTVLGGRSEEWIPWAVLGTGLVGGLVALAIERIIMTIATSAIGAWLLVSAFLVFVNDNASLNTDKWLDMLNVREDWIPPACWAVLASAGILSQFATYREKQPQPE